MRRVEERVILVDEADREIRTQEKLAAHKEGALHRAFSVFVLDKDGRLLLQRRAADKYHSAGLWSNTCCGHPRPGEEALDAARRRLREEMGFDCPLERAGAFVYRTKLANGLVEHEYDHVFAGAFDGDPAPDPAEVSEWRWVAVDEIVKELRRRRAGYTVWFKPALDTVLQQRKAPGPRRETRRRRRS